MNTNDEKQQLINCIGDTTSSTNTLLEIIKDRFQYSLEHRGLVYKKWFNGLPKDRVGTKIGFKNPRGYHIVQINGKFYREHQLVWLLFKEELVVGNKEAVIDHKDNDPTNCLIDNLRKITQRENTRSRINTKHHNIFKTPSNTYSVFINFGQQKITIANVASIEQAEFIRYYLKYKIGETEENALKLKERYRGGVRKNKHIIEKDMEVLDAM